MIIREQALKYQRLLVKEPPDTLKIFSVSRRFAKNHYRMMARYASAMNCSNR